MNKEYLYHFTSAKKAFNYILKTMKLRYSKIPTLNDPFEVKRFRFDVWQPFSQKIGYDFLSKRKKIKDYYDMNANIICFSTDVKNNKLERKGFHLFQMWAHYADNHKGVCLVFDKETLLKELNTISPDKYLIFKGIVQYKDFIKEPPTFYETAKNRNFDNKNYLLKHLNTRKIDLFFTKDKQWSDEYEYRIVLFYKKERKKNIKNEYININKSLENIILGNDFSKNKNDYYNEIINIKNKYNIKINKLVNNAFTLYSKNGLPFK